MIILYFFLYIILQAVLPQGLFLFHIRADFLLILAIFVGLFNLRNWLLLAVLLGFIKDIFSLSPFGLNISCFGLWAFVSYELSRQIYRDNRAVYLLLAACATLTNYAVYFFIRGNTLAGGPIYLIAFIEAAYNSLFAYLFFKPFKKCASDYSLR